MANNKTATKAKTTKVAAGMPQPVTAQVLPLNSLTRIRANKISTVTQYSPLAVITVVSAACPHRPGSFRAMAFGLACNASTVGAYMANNVKGQPVLVKYKYLGRWAAMGLLHIA